VRIVYLNPCGRLGGAETSLRELLASVRAAEPEWELWLVLGEDGPLADQAREIGVKVIVLEFPPALARLGDAGSRFWATLASLLKAVWATSLYSRRLARTIRLIAPEIIHTNGFKMHLLGAWVRSRHTPLVWHIHDYVQSRRLVSRLLRLFGGACTLAITNSRSVAADLNALLPNLNVVTIYNAVDLKRFAPAGNKLDLDQLAGLSPAAQGTVRVGLVATLARWKGHRIFLEALSRVSPGMPIRGYVIGGPIYQTDGSQWSLEELQQEADRLGLAGTVGFTGFVEDAAAAMRSLDIVVHASTDPEPFGMVIIEAMACEKALIASQAGGASELIIDGEDALAHPPGDAEALAEQIRRLAGDLELRQRLGKAGRAKTEGLYHGARLANELLSAYRGLSDHASGHVGQVTPGAVMRSSVRTLSK
jgi:glycosyltransferase involved in cell wall biosynthesis